MKNLAALLSPLVGLLCLGMFAYLARPSGPPQLIPLPRGWLGVLTIVLLGGAALILSRVGATSNYPKVAKVGMWIASIGLAALVALVLWMILLVASGGLPV